MLMRDTYKTTIALESIGPLDVVLCGEEVTVSDTRDVIAEGYWDAEFGLCDFFTVGPFHHSFARPGRFRALENAVEQALKTVTVEED